MHIDRDRLATQPQRQLYNHILLAKVVLQLLQAFVKAIALPVDAEIDHTNFVSDLLLSS